MCVCVCWGSAQGENSIVQLQDLESHWGWGEALALFSDWGRGEEDLRHREDVPVPGQAPDRNIIRCQARSRKLGPEQEPGQGDQDGGCTHSSLGPTHLSPSPGLLHKDPTCGPLLPPDLPGICQSRLIPTPSFLSAPKTQQIPWGPEGSLVRGGRGVRVVGGDAGDKPAPLAIFKLGLEGTSDC